VIDIGRIDLGASLEELSHYFLVALSHALSQ